MLSCRTLAGFASTKKNARHTKKKSPRISKSTTRHLLKIDAAPARLFMNQWACWAIIWSSRVLQPPRCIQNTICIYRFSSSAVYLRVMLLLGGNRISIHSLYPFHLHRGLDRGAFWIQSHSHTNDLLWAGRCVGEGAGHRGACSWLCGYNEFKKWESNLVRHFPPKTAAFRISHTLKWTPLWQSANRSSQKEVLNWIEW